MDDDAGESLFLWSDSANSMSLENDVLLASDLESWIGSDVEIERGYDEREGGKTKKNDDALYEGLLKEAKRRQKDSPGRHVMSLEEVNQYMREAYPTLPNHYFLDTEVPRGGATGEKGRKGEERRGETDLRTISIFDRYKLDMEKKKNSHQKLVEKVRAEEKKILTFNPQILERSRHLAEKKRRDAVTRVCLGEERGEERRGGIGEEKRKREIRRLTRQLQLESGVVFDGEEGEESRGEEKRGETGEKRLGEKKAILGDFLMRQKLYEEKLMEKKEKIRQKIQETETPFRPEINAVSQTLTVRTKEETQDEKVCRLYQNNNHQKKKRGEIKEEKKFQPEINENSKKIAKNRKFDDLLKESLPPPPLPSSSVFVSPPSSPSVPKHYVPQKCLELYHQGQEFLERKNLRIEEERRGEERKKLMGCTFHPSINDSQQSLLRTKLRAKVVSTNLIPSPSPNHEMSSRSISPSHRSPYPSYPIQPRLYESPSRSPSPSIQIPGIQNFLMRKIKADKNKAEKIEREKKLFLSDIHLRKPTSQFLTTVQRPFALSHTRESSQWRDQPHPVSKSRSFSQSRPQSQSHSLSFTQTQSRLPIQSQSRSQYPSNHPSQSRSRHSPPRNIRNQFNYLPPQRHETPHFSSRDGTPSQQEDLLSSNFDDERNFDALEHWLDQIEKDAFAVEKLLSDIPPPPLAVSDAYHQK